MRKWRLGPREVLACWVTAGNGGAGCRDLQSLLVLCPHHTHHGRVSGVKSWPLPRNKDLSLPSGKTSQPEGTPNGVFRAKYAWVPSGHTVRTLHEDSVEGQGCQLTSDQELPVPLPPSIYDSRFCQHTRLMGLTLCK